MAASRDPLTTATASPLSGGSSPLKGTSDLDEVNSSEKEKQPLAFSIAKILEPDKENSEMRDRNFYPPFNVMSEDFYKRTSFANPLFFPPMQRRDEMEQIDMNFSLGHQRNLQMNLDDFYQPDPKRLMETSGIQDMKCHINNVCPPTNFLHQRSEDLRHYGSMSSVLPHHQLIRNNSYVPWEDLTSSSNLLSTDSSMSYKIIRPQPVRPIPRVSRKSDETKDSVSVMPSTQTIGSTHTMLASDPKFAPNAGVHAAYKPCVCEHCRKGFPLKFCYYSHKKIHKEEKTLKCTVCNKAFFRASDLGQHMITHEDKKRYTCKVCGKALKRNCCLQKHMRRFHHNGLSATGAEHAHENSCSIRN